MEHLIEEITTRTRELLESYLKKKAAPRGNYRDLQESALCDVIKLSAAAADPVIEQIESEYQAAKNLVDGSYKYAKEQHDKTFKAEFDVVDRTCADHLAKLNKEHDSQKQQLLTQTKNEKEKVSDNVEIALTQDKSNYEYELMVADVVQKGNIAKRQKKTAELNGSVAAKQSQIDDLTRQTQRILSTYKMSLDKPNPEPDATPHKDLLNTAQQHEAIAAVYIRKVDSLLLPPIFLKPVRFIIAAAICAAYVFTVWIIGKSMRWPASEFVTIAAVGLLALAALLVISGRLLRKKARYDLLHYSQLISQALAKADWALKTHLQDSLSQIEQEYVQATQKLEHEKQAAAQKFEKAKAAAENTHKQLMRNQNVQFGKTQRESELRYNEQIAAIEQQRAQQHHEIQTRYDEQLKAINDSFASYSRQVETEFDSFRQQLRQAWIDGINNCKTLIAQTQKLNAAMFDNWQSDAWSRWTADNRTPQHLIRFGKIDFDLHACAAPVKALMDADLQNLGPVSVPAVLAFPDHCSLYVHTPAADKYQGLNLIKAVMTRLFTSVPAGLVHFNIFDPVGLGENFVGFMHATDYEKKLVGGRIWTDSEHIQKCLTELTAHMENVIQKYLRNEFETIEAYNLQAGELAEPYRFLIIADFPANFTDESIRRLKSILNSGPKCGVYTLIATDDSQRLPQGITTRDLSENGVGLTYRNGTFIWQDDVFKNFALETDTPPSENVLTDIVTKVAIASIDATRVEVPFETIAPSASQRWTQDSTFEIKIPIGRAGAKRLQYLELGKGVNQHMLIAGKTGSGKSTLLHTIITNLAQWYSPDEVELYLIDFKQGVEFKTYATHKLPHARAVAIESDREFGLSMLQKLDAVMEQRGDKFRQARVQDISSYRQAAKVKMPRTILICDEFHILFAEDDSIAHEASMLLEKLVRQGRAFGIHIILGSQSLAGTSGLSRSIMGQMAVRIALQCSEMDSQFILNEDNVVARLLSRPGEAIYNDAGGMVVGNNPFQVAWLPKTTHDQYLENLHAMERKAQLPHEAMIVFEGNVAADISNNMMLAKCLQAPVHTTSSLPLRAWLGEAVVIKDPTAAEFGRQNGANMLLVGQQDFAMAGVLSSSLISLLSQCGQASGNFLIVNGAPATSLITTSLKKIEALFPSLCRFVNPNEIAEVFNELAQEVQRRLDNGSDNGAPQFLFISSLQRFRMLYKKEEDWNTRSDDATVSPDKLLAQILRDGPAVGIHTIVGVDTFTTVDRVIDRQTLREFNNRVLFQMSASDSNNLIDTPIANGLGFQRALFYNEEQGVLEKFRFYAPPSEQWLKQLSAAPASEI